MLQELEQIVTLSITFEEIIRNAIVALVCGVIVSLLYRATYKGQMYSPTFAQSLVLLSMITAVVIMVIGGNLARAFGLVGAMAIIRFRTAVKEMQDIIFIFFALAVGMAAGAGLTAVAITGTIVVGAVALLLSRLPTSLRNRKEYLLQFMYSGPGDGNATYLPILQKYCIRTRLLNMKSMGEGDAIELSFHVRLKDEKKGNELVRELRAPGNVERVNLFFDEEYF